MTLLARFLFRYGTLLALLAICTLSSVLTINRQAPTGRNAAAQILSDIRSQIRAGGGVLVATLDNESDRTLSASLDAELAAEGYEVLAIVRGEPADVRRSIREITSRGRTIDAIACSEGAAKWQILSHLAEIEPSLAQAKVIRPHSSLWPNFLRRDNLLNIADQIAVIAIVSVGMTFIIVAGGIDLSVGSLIALSSIVATLLIRDYFGAQEASSYSMVFASLVAIAVCSAVGLFSGSCVVALDIPPFIVTLAMMLVARGSAKILSNGNTIYQVPESFTWLSRGKVFFGIPNAVVLMISLYVAAHVLLSKTVLGRYIYAVGGNRQAAFLSGVRVKQVLLFTYLASGFLAGLGGVVVASNYRSGSPNYGDGDELDVIAAVVVGGTSLSGGRGTIFGTLIGAFIIAVIRNTMNLLNVPSFTQDVISGLVILAAVTMDRLKMRYVRD